MTELKLSTAAEVTKPVEKIAEVVKAPAAATPPVADTAAAPVEAAKVAEKTTAV